MKAGLPDDEIKKLLKLATSAEIKEKLKRSTQEALDYGVLYNNYIIIIVLLFLQYAHISNCAFLHFFGFGFFSDHTAKLVGFLFSTAGYRFQRFETTYFYMQIQKKHSDKNKGHAYPSEFRVMIAIAIKLFSKVVLLEAIVL